MEVLTLRVGPYQVNCYLLVKGDDCIIIDPGDEWDRIQKVLVDRDLTVLAVLITHSHFDHIGGLVGNDYLKDVPVFAHKNESSHMEDPFKNLSVSGGNHLVAAATDFVEEGKLLTIRNLDIEIIEIFGHTENSICYYFKDYGMVFTGDTLFAGSVGRTDFLGVPIGELVAEIKSKLLVLDEQTKVYPGHGPATSIGIEKKTNPYMR